MNEIYIAMGIVGALIVYRIFYIHRKPKTSLLEKEYLDVLNSDKYKVK